MFSSSASSIPTSRGCGRYEAEADAAREAAFSGEAGVEPGALKFRFAFSDVLSFGLLSSAARWDSSFEVFAIFTKLAGGLTFGGAGPDNTAAVIVAAAAVVAVVVGVSTSTRRTGLRRRGPSGK